MPEKPATEIYVRRNCPACKGTKRIREPRPGYEVVRVCHDCTDGYAYLWLPLALVMKPNTEIKVN
jgi:glutaredoxin